VERAHRLGAARSSRHFTRRPAPPEGRIPASFRSQEAELELEAMVATVEGVVGVLEEGAALFYLDTLHPLRVRCRSVANSAALRHLMNLAMLTLAVCLSVDGARELGTPVHSAIGIITLVRRRSGGVGGG
jgi:hypothetical protein